MANQNNESYISFLTAAEIYRKEIEDILSEMDVRDILDIDEEDPEQQKLRTKCNFYREQYEKMINQIIDMRSKDWFGMNIEMAIATKRQEEIEKAFMNAGDGYVAIQSRINDKIDAISIKLNKRFTFGPAELVHLIEASKASNIIFEEGGIQALPNGKISVLRQNKNGDYYFAAVDRGQKNIYTNGRFIPTNQLVRGDGKTSIITGVDLDKNVDIRSYPSGAESIVYAVDQQQLMQDVMRNLFKNLRMCLDLYEMLYIESPSFDSDSVIFFDERSSTDRKGKTIDNTVNLPDDASFNFKFEINEWNFPHLLGIQSNGENVPEATKKYFSVMKNGTVEFPYNEHTPAIRKLKLILQNEERIIADGGLVEENGKLYQLLPWEKIIIKTASFMRGDFFKNCFCIIELANGINSRNEKFASISSTKYSEGIQDGRLDCKKVIRDLINAKKQDKDFIFRTFMEDPNANGLYVPASIVTGKSENIITKDNTRVKTLERFRRELKQSPSSNGGIATSIENEIAGERKFSSLEQLLLALDIEYGLGMKANLSEELKDFEEKLAQQADKIIEKGLEEQLTREKQESTTESAILDYNNAETEKLIEEYLKQEELRNTETLKKSKKTKK